MEGSSEAVPAETSVVEGRQDRGPTFGHEVVPQHRRLQPDGDVYVVGDVHGCLAELQRLWARLRPEPADRVVFVGDLVRKGPDSVGVVEFVASRPNAVSVLGNNEAKVLRGEATVSEDDNLRERLADFPLVVSWGDAVVVHGGVHPERALADQAPEDFLTLRSVPPGNGYDGPFWFEEYAGPPRVFFGHTVLAEPVVDEWTVGLDTGCVYGGALSAYDCSRDRIVRVPAEETYRERPDAKVVSA